MILLNKNEGRGFALLAALIFLALSMLLLSTFLSTSQYAVTATTNSVSAMQLRAAVVSGAEYAEQQIRQRDFSDLFKGVNQSSDTDSETARRLSFRNPLSRTTLTQTDWNDLRYDEPDDGLLHDGFTVLNRSGLLLNRCKLFFKVTNNPDDPGGPFEDTDDLVVLRVAGVNPLPYPLTGSRVARNICEIVELQLRRTTAFLGPSAIYCPAGKLHIDLVAGGKIAGQPEVGTGAAVATGETTADIKLASSDQLEGNPVVSDLSADIRYDNRLRWLVDVAFVDHWKRRIGKYASEYGSQDGRSAIHWFPAGVEMASGEILRGIIFSSGPVVLHQSARIEGLLVLIESASLQLFDFSSLSGTVTAVGTGQSFDIALHDQAQVEYRPSVVRESLRLLPLSHTQFRTITPEMEM
ncbi:MAG: hypothetical protein HY644_11905 [Acidobacteria bacterium]|nr:hypothetical protein [Acidobacteriota bacterium]